MDQLVKQSFTNNLEHCVCKFGQAHFYLYYYYLCIQGHLPHMQTAEHDGDLWLKVIARTRAGVFVVMAKQHEEKL